MFSMKLTNQDYKDLDKVLAELFENHSFFWSHDLPHQVPIAPNKSLSRVKIWSMIDLLIKEDNTPVKLQYIQCHAATARAFYYIGERPTLEQLGIGQEWIFVDNAGYRVSNSRLLELREVKCNTKKLPTIK